MALQKGPSHGTGGPSGQVFNQRRNPGRPECEHRWGAPGWGAPGRGPQCLASEGLDSVPTGPPRFSMAPAGRARQRARTRARNWTECRREKQPTGGVKRPGGGGCEAQRHELPHPSSGMVRPQGLHAALSRAAVPTGRRRPRATRTAAAHGRGRTPRRATLLELAPRPPQGPAQNHMPRVRPRPAPHPAPAGTAASRHAAPAPRRSPPGSRRAPGSAGGT